MQYLRNLFMLGLVISPVYLMANPVLEEVVVSARKVDESFQDVPIGMTVFTSSDVGCWNRKTRRFYCSYSKCCYGKYSKCW